MGNYQETCKSNYKTYILNLYQNFSIIKILLKIYYNLFSICIVRYIFFLDANRSDSLR